MIRTVIIATLSLLLGLFTGTIWSKHHRPLLGNFHEPDGVLAYGSHSGLLGPTGVQDDSGVDSNGQIRRHEKSTDPVIPAEIGRLYKTIGDDGRLTAGIEELAGLDEATALLVQEEIDKSFARHKELVKQNLKIISDGTGGGGEGIKYQISAFPEGGLQIWEELQNQMKLIAGKQAAAFLIAAFNPDQQFGSMGQYDYRFNFQKPDNDMMNSIDVEILEPGADIVGNRGVVNRNKLPLWMQGLFDDQE